MRLATVKLRTRIGVYFLGLVATWTLFVLILLGDMLSRTSRELLQDRGAQVARLLVHECATLVHDEDVSALTRLLAERTKEPSDVRYVVVLASGGEVVASTFERGVPEPLMKVAHTRTLDSGVRVQLIETYEEQLYDYEAREAGIRVRMGMSLVSVQLFAEQLTRYILWIGLAALLGVFAGSLQISRPVEALAMAVAKSAEAAGVRIRAPLDATVETSALADWFYETLARLEERTKQLDRSKKLAYLGEISTSIAHEINNPLGVIVLNAGFLTKRVASGELAGPAAAEVGRVRSAALRATLAAQKLLQFARYSTQRGGLQRRPVHPEPFIRETVELLRDRIRLAECTVEVAVQPDMRPLPLDLQGMQQVLFNLLTNALDASRPGGRISVSASIEGNWFSLSVADEGQGMQADFVEHAKEPFVTTKEPGKGTGLGLAISDQIVQRHGGELTLQSKVEKGTTATVRVPLGATS